MTGEGFGPGHDKYFERVVDGIHEAYGRSISDLEARHAAHNLIGFVRTLLEIRAEKCQNDG